MQNLCVGDKVEVHFFSGVSQGTVVKITTVPTINQPGVWVDIDRGKGPEGMPSYLLKKTE